MQENNLENGKKKKVLFIVSTGIGEEEKVYEALQEKYGSGIISLEYSVGVVNKICLTARIDDLRDEYRYIADLTGLRPEMHVLSDKLKPQNTLNPETSKSNTNKG